MLTDIRKNSKCLDMDQEPHQQNHAERPSHADIAAALGIGKSTVSRALSGKGYVSAEMKAKVEAKAREINYVPDPALKALNQRRWKHRDKAYHIAFFRKFKTFATPDGIPTEINPNSSMEIPEKMKAYAESKGYLFSIHDFPGIKKAQHFGMQLYNRGVDAVIVENNAPCEAWNFPWEHFSCVTIHFDFEGNRSNNVCTDWFGAVNLAVEHAQAKGAQRPGFCLFPKLNPSMDQRIEAAVMWQQNQLRIAFGKQPAVFKYPVEPERRFDYASERTRFRSWFQRHKPDCLIDSNSQAYWFLKDLGWERRCPLFQLKAGPDTTNPQVSGAQHPHLSCGYQAIDLAGSLIEKRRRGFPEEPFRITIPCRWHDA